MKKLVLDCVLLVLFSAVIFVACKKSDTTTAANNFDTEASAQSDDQTNFSTQIEAVADEINLVMESSASLAGRTDGIYIPCHATLTADSTSSTRSITITYNGADCLGLYNRVGVVSISIPSGTHWAVAGAALTVTYTNLAVTRIADNKSFLINGSHVITNVSGGLLITLPIHSVTHTITSSGMNVTFGNGTQRSWQVARQRVFTYNNNNVVITITGTHTEGNVTNVAEWGTNRFGRPFTSAIIQPLVIRGDCNYRLVSGQVKHTVPVFTATATFGLNSAGNPTTCPGAGQHYYVKIDWEGQNNNSHSIILPY